MEKNKKTWGDVYMLRVELRRFTARLRRLDMRLSELRQEKTDTLEVLAKLQLDLSLALDDVRDP